MKLLVSSSVAPFREKAEKIWGLERYRFPQDIFKPVVYFGLYHWADYLYFLAHRGEKSVLWAGYDLINLKNNRLPWYKMFRGVSNFVENRVEQKELEAFGIFSRIRPSFLEDVWDFPISYKYVERPNVYITGHADREEEYGFGLVKRVAEKVSEVEFHIYGTYYVMDYRDCSNNNIITHGRVPPEQFNEEIRNYQAGLRLNEHDGFSEITAKSILMGQYPITRIKYPMIDNYETEEELVSLLKELKNKKEPNIKAREFWIKNINQFPWTEKKF